MSVSILEIDNKVGNQQRLTFATLNPVHSLYQASHDIDKMQWDWQQARDNYTLKKIEIFVSYETQNKWSKWMKHHKQGFHISSISSTVK